MLTHLFKFSSKLNEWICMQLQLIFSKIMYSTCKSIADGFMLSHPLPCAVESKWTVFSAELVKLIETTHLYWKPWTKVYLLPFGNANRNTNNLPTRTNRQYDSLSYDIGWVLNFQFSHSHWLCNVTIGLFLFNEWLLTTWISEIGWENIFFGLVADLMCNTMKVPTLIF